MEPNKLQAKAVTQKIDGKLLAVASEEVVDRDGDILSIDGWDLKNFKMNPVLLYSHNLTGRTLPIGRAKTIGYREIDGKRKLVFEPEFEEITEEGKIVAEFYRQEFMKAWSVGFIPKDAERLSPEGEWPPRYKYNKQELIEISAVPIPALPSAVVVAGAKHFNMDVDKMKSLVHDKLGLDVKDEEPEPKEDEKPEEKPEEVVEKPVQPEETEKEEEKGVKDVEIKSGRVLSKSNENKIREAVDLLSGVLSALEKESDKDEKEDEKSGKTLEDRVAHVENLMKNLIGEIQAERNENKKKLVDIDIADPEFVKVMQAVARAVPLAIHKAKQMKRSKEGGGDEK